MPNAEQIAERLRELLTNSGREVADDPFYKVTVDHQWVSGLHYAFAIRFPQEVESVTAMTARLVVFRYNELYPTEQLSLNSSAAGRDLKYMGMNDHPHITLVLITRVG